MSVLSTTPCPQCSSEAEYELDLRRRREFVFCTHCGYERSIITLIDSKTRRFKVKKNGELITRTKERRGFGCWSVFYKDGSGVLGAFTSPVTKETVQRFEEELGSRGVSV